jgi:transglutaminase-like putative cysteine protease
MGEQRKIEAFVKRKPVRLTLFLSFVVSLSNLAVLAADSGPTGAARFSPEAAVLYLTATPHVLTDDAEAVVLESQRTFTFDAEGNYVENRYIVYKVLNIAGAEDWASISVEWEPWHEERPTLRARVLTADKAVHELDPKTITNAPAKDQDDSVFSDRSVLRAPLPAIAPGSIVEEEEVVTVKPIFPGAGTLERLFFGEEVPREHTRITLEAPASLALSYQLQLAPEVTPERSEAGGKVRIVFDRGPVDAFESADANLPSDVPAYPNMTFTTGASWQKVAQGYDQIVETQIAIGDVKALVAKLTAGKATREQKAAAIVAYLNRDIRYTGVEFGDAAVVGRALPPRRSHANTATARTRHLCWSRCCEVPAFLHT